MLNEALDLLRLGLQVLPIRANKVPIGGWKHLQTETQSEADATENFNRASHRETVAGIGVLTGQISGYLEVIDVDTKHDRAKTLWADFYGLIKDNLPEVADALVIGQTRSGGYHLYYRCPELAGLAKPAGNTKLANRPTTDEERAVNKDEKLVVLIETRGEGGYVVAPPTPEYVIIHGDLSAIPVFSLETRNYLLGIARSLTEYVEPEPEPQRQRQSGQPINDSDSPFKAYNQQADAVGFLESKGWTVVSQSGQRTHLKRPGQSDARDSGNFHEGFRKMFIFSSSTEFPAEKALSPSDLFIQLECNGNLSEASRRLLDMGYGTRRGQQKKAYESVKTDNIRVEGKATGQAEGDLTTDGHLTAESIRETPMDAVYIYYTEDQATGEVIKALELLEKVAEEQENPPKVYLRLLSDKADKSSWTDTIRAYEFRAYDIMRRYDEAGGVDIQPDDEDRLLREFVAVGVTIASPIERQWYEDLILNFSEENRLRIDKKALQDTLDKIHYDQQKVKQREAISQLLKDAEVLNKQGDMSEALKELNLRGRDISTIASNETFKGLITPISEAEMAERIKKKNTDLKTGYLIGDEELLLPAGAITIIAAPTSHGKTTFLLNLALIAADELPDKNIYVLSYEEDADSVTISAMNTYIGRQEKKHNDRLMSANHRRTIRSYYRNPDEDYFSRGKKSHFEKYKGQFFDQLISTGRLSIQYAEYDADTLNQAIRYLHKHGNAGAIFIDYVQLIRMKETKLSRQLELKDICLDLKDVAVETGLPIVLGAQFSRQVVNAARMHPTNIGESGDIERAANVIVGFWNNQFKPLSDNSEKELETLNRYRHDPNLFYAVILKNRGGRVGTDGMLMHDGNTGVIENEDTSFSVTSDVPFDVNAIKIDNSI